jgi:hypothetical protein
MNERIKELAEQCHWETYGVNGELLASGFDEEKFAMLVIQDYENDKRESRREIKSELGYSRIGRNNV